jgi:hypothetical protein
MTKFGDFLKLYFFQNLATNNSKKTINFHQIVKEIRYLTKFRPKKSMFYTIKAKFPNFFVRKMTKFVPENIYIGGEYCFYHFCNVPNQSDDYIYIIFIHGM